jgi:hypothetical protein
MCDSVAAALEHEFGGNASPPGTGAAEIDADVDALLNLIDAAIGCGDRAQVDAAAAAARAVESARLEGPLATLAQYAEQLPAAAAAAAAVPAAARGGASETERRLGEKAFWTGRVITPLEPEPEPEPEPGDGDADFMLVVCPEKVGPRGDLIAITTPDGRDVEAEVPSYPDRPWRRVTVLRASLFHCMPIIKNRARPVGIAAPRCMAAACRCRMASDPAASSRCTRRRARWGAGHARPAPRRAFAAIYS